MKKINRKQVFRIINRVVILAIVIVLFFTLPMIKLNNDDLSMIYSTFLGRKSKYQGIIEVWNIDTFESGSVSKSNFLTSEAKVFQNKNKGLFVMVRNMTEQECLYALKEGECPDLFSCSYGVSKQIKYYISSFSSKPKIRDEYLKAGTMNDSLYGLAWCRGCYFLISTKEKLEKAKVYDEEKVSLGDLALNSGYQIKKKNSTKTVYSMTYGTNKYGMPQEALKAYNIMGEPSKSEFALNADILSQSSYLAYSRFVANESVILLGTQRDVVRMENKVKLGKASDVIYQPLTKFSDMVQFFFLGKNENTDRRYYAEEFAKFVTTPSEQKKLGAINMFPVRTAYAEGYEMSVMKDIIPEINASLTVFNVFD